MAVISRNRGGTIVQAQAVAVISRNRGEAWPYTHHLIEPTRNKIYFELTRSVGWHIMVNGIRMCYKCGSEGECDGIRSIVDVSRRNIMRRFREAKAPLSWQNQPRKHKILPREADKSSHMLDLIAVQTHRLISGQTVITVAPANSVHRQRDQILGSRRDTTSAEISRAKQNIMFGSINRTYRHNNAK